MLKRAEEVITSGDTRAAVDFAISMNRQVLKGKRELDLIKAHLRTLAAAKDPGDTDFAVELEGNVGDAFVQFPADEPRVVKGHDLRDIEANLSVETFAALFTKTTTVKPVRDYLSRLPALEPAERAVVDRFVAAHTPTPKVNLPR